MSSLSTYMKLTDERPAESDIGLSLASHSYIYPLGIAEDVLVEVAENVYHVKFVILDLKEDEKRPFTLGTPFLTTPRPISESLCKIERGVKNNIEPIAPTMTVDRLVSKWEERIKLHMEREMEFDQWKSKNFKGKHPALVKVEGRTDDEGEVTSDGKMRFPWEKMRVKDGEKRNSMELTSNTCVSEFIPTDSGLRRFRFLKEMVVEIRRGYEVES
uniref:Reverse transcriptase domain-containing protein n=1 Tax=Tanacetum cinerariifolium TaxID=118510 RepID=A0A6L2LFT0_TANCI|nr:reverse transcriptase domain-containing protein [Tanacetum cinerariifolium]